MSIGGNMHVVQRLIKKLQAIKELQAKEKKKQNQTNRSKGAKKQMITSGRKVKVKRLSGWKKSWRRNDDADGFLKSYKPGRTTKNFIKKLPDGKTLAEEEADMLRSRELEKNKVMVIEVIAKNIIDALEYEVRTMGVDKQHEADALRRLSSASISILPSADFGHDYFHVNIKGEGFTLTKDFRKNDPVITGSWKNEKESDAERNGDPFSIEDMDEEDRDAYISDMWKEASEAEMKDLVKEREREFEMDPDSAGMIDIDGMIEQSNIEIAKGEEHFIRARNLIQESKEIEKAARLKAEKKNSIPYEHVESLIERFSGEFLREIDIIIHKMVHNFHTSFKQELVRHFGQDVIPFATKFANNKLEDSMLGFTETITKMITSKERK